MTWPITDLTIERFRGIRDLHLSGLGQVNLLVGGNNSGKTSVLEALSVYSAPLDPWTWISTSGRREPGFVGRTTNVDRLRWLFPQEVSADPSALYEGSVRVRAKGSADVQGFTAGLQEVHGTRIAPGHVERDAAGENPVYVVDEPELEVERRGVQLDVQIEARVKQPSLFGPEDKNTLVLWENERFSSPRKSVGPSLPCEVITSYDHWFRSLPVRRFSEARMGGFEDAVLKLLTSIDPRIVGVEVLAPRGPEAVLYLRDAVAGLLPLSAFGDGLRRILLMALAIPRASNGVLLVDELETAIHVSALAKVFRWMLDACKEHNVQLFATTHSLEALDAVLEADTTPEEDIVGYRLERADDGTSAKRYGEDLLKRLRSERGLDVR